MGFAALVAIINTKLPQVSELVEMRIISQFKELFKRNNKVAFFGDRFFFTYCLHLFAIRSFSPI
jgi:pre-mRNA-splicing factor CWC22